MLNKLFLPGIYVKCISFEDGTRCSKVVRSFRNFTRVASENNLKNHLRNKIKVTGPITFAEYMKECLSNPFFGYYMSKDMFGRKGDFITSPEVSQLFGEMVGAWCLDAWTRLGTFKPMQIVELGPGRGTLAKDILRVVNKTRFRNEVTEENFSMNFVETSPFLSRIQIESLCSISSPLFDDATDAYFSAIGNQGHRCNWFRHLEQVPRKFTIFIAHEFFDAMPVHKLQKKNGLWREVLVDINSTEDFRYVLSSNPTPASILYSKEFPNCLLNEAEYSPDSGILIDLIGTRIVEDGGTVLIGDYGHEGKNGDTIRSFSHHQIVNPLIKPGEVDITADVNFQYLKNKVKNQRILTFGPVTQKSFLIASGIDFRLKNILLNCDTSQAKDLQSGYNSLVDSDKMGEKFKFMCMFPSIMENVFKRLPVPGFPPTVQ